jgi:diguanylate cyclase (GGDEF)-like protein
VSYLLPVLVGFFFITTAALGWYVARLRAQRSALYRRIKKMDHAQRALKSQAYSDHLTGLANRNLLADRYGRAMQRAKRNREQFALLMIDLNKFKAINDTFGHGAGDQVLIEVSRRLLANVRATDTVARYGGDEFVLLIESFGERRELTRIAMKLVDALSEPVTLETGVKVSVGASVGYALFPDDGAHLENLLEVADHAMYECKTSGVMPLFD